MAVHPSRPHLAATGSSGGTVAVWDLRFRDEPMRHALAGSADVWQVWPTSALSAGRPNGHGFGLPCCAALSAL